MPDPLPRGVLAAQPPAPRSRAETACLRLSKIDGDDPVDAQDNALQCSVSEFRVLHKDRWAMARYGWAKPPAGASPEIKAEETVLFELAKDGRPRAVWHDRFNTGEDAVWRSITPAVARRPDGSTLLAITSCVNGTGGCGQYFLQRRRGGAWITVDEPWRKQLPPGFFGRIRHGSAIDPVTLIGDAGFYADDDPNCCPSQELRVDLALSHGRLTLRRYSVARAPRADNTPSADQRD